MSEFVIEHLDPKELAPHPLNFRRHPMGQRQALSASLDEHGWLAAPIWNRRTGHLLDGHARIELAVERAEAAIPVRVIDVTEEQERRILRAFDRIGALAMEDPLVLQDLIRAVGDMDLEALLSGAGEVPNFEPVGEDEQGRLDEKAKVICPSCGHEFAP